MAATMLTAVTSTREDAEVVQKVTGKPYQPVLRLFVQNAQ
jgi:hypothetical protein